jgi:hypothetical protein
MSDDPTASMSGLDVCRALIHRHVREACEEGAPVPGGNGAIVADSIVLAEVIAETARALRSVDAFAALLHGLFTAQEGNVHA